MKRYPIATLLFITFTTNILTAQNPDDPDILGRKFNPIKHALPFLTISPDSRSAGMGDVGVSTSADAYSTNWNVGKLASIEGKAGIGLGYTPWLRKLNVKDINLTYLSGYYRLDENQVVGTSLRYFSLGSMIFTDNQGNVIKDFNPNEFALDASYSRSLGPNFFMGLSARYIYSNLTGTMQLGNETLKPANAFAVDLGAFYKKEIRLGDYPTVITGGLAFTNVGTKVTYSENNKNFLPMNLRLGGGMNHELDQYNQLGYYVEVNKLMVPTPDIRDTLNSYQNLSVASAIFQSFSDAPGYNTSKFKEELQEIMWSFGVEYIYDKKFAIRAGYFHENEFKGNRKYVTAGAGFKLNMLSMDISYLIPTVANHPLAQTLRFSLVLDLGALME